MCMGKQVAADHTHLLHSVRACMGVGGTYQAGGAAGGACTHGLPCSAKHAVA
jgi:hypothetical protein